MHTTRYYRCLCSSLGCFLILLLAACGSTPVANNATPTSTTATLQPGKTPVVTPTITTEPVPPTQTSCPAVGTARAAVYAPLALGSHTNIVYIVNEFQGTSPAFGTLKRYDVKSGIKTEILKMPGSIASAQLSADGQWILFVSVISYSSGPQKLQMVRMDGQGLQTLYCSSTYIANPRWSTNQKNVMFSNFANGQETLYLLNMTTGDLQRELTFSSKGGSNQGFNLGTWLDNTRIYVTNIPVDQPHDALYILDTGKGANQHVSDLIPVVVHKIFGDFDSSYDGSQLFVDYGYCGQGGCYPPAVITAQPATGGTETTIYNSQQYDTVSVRAVTQHTLLVLIENSNVVNAKTDKSHNGLWKMNTDGSGLTSLSIETQGQFSILSNYSQNPWSNVSRDGSMYALQQNSAAGQTQTLLYGSLNGGNPTSFASIADGTQLSVVGWTTM